MRKIVIIICLLIFSVATLASIFATTDDGERVILHEDGTWEYFRPPESNDEVDLNDYDREYEIGNLEITVHSVERLNDFLIVDVSVVNNYPFGIWLMQDYFFLLYGRTKSPLILEESNIGQKYMNALLTEKYGTYLSAYGKIRGYLVFSVKGNMQSQKLLIDIPEEDNDIEDIWGEHVLDITGVKAPIFYERIDYPLKFLGVEITYHNYSDCLFVRVQNTSSAKHIKQNN